jgi:hypothetical protein
MDLALIESQTVKREEALAGKASGESVWEIVRRYNVGAATIPRTKGPIGATL